MTETKIIQLSESCPARCKTNGRCYGKAVFLGKPGKSKECDCKCNYIKKSKMLNEIKRTQQII